MSAKRSPKIARKIGSGLVVGMIFWLVWEGVHGLMRIIQDGRIINRRGPDVYIGDSPFIFWALSGFFALGIILTIGLGVICLLDLLSLFRRSDY